MPLFSQPGRFEQLASVEQPQQQAIMQMLQQALGQMQNPTQGFQPIAQQAREQFQQNTVPTIAERFTSMGGGGQRSSAFAGQLGQAGAGLESQLAGQQAQFGQQQQGLAQQLAQLGLSPTFQYGYHPERAGALEKFGGLAAQFGGQALGSYMGAGGNPLKALMGMFGGGGQGGGQGGGMVPQQRVGQMGFRQGGY